MLFISRFSYFTDPNVKVVGATGSSPGGGSVNSLIAVDMASGDIYYDTMIITGIVALDRMKYGGVEILLITIGGTAFLVGMIATMVMAMMNPNSAINYISLYTMFVDRLGKEGKKRSDVEYLTEQQGKEMRPVR